MPGTGSISSSLRYRKYANTAVLRLPFDRDIQYTVFQKRRGVELL